MRLGYVSGMNVKRDGKGNFQECFKETLITNFYRNFTRFFYRKYIFFSFTKIGFVGLTFVLNNIL